MDTETLPVTDHTEERALVGVLEIVLVFSVTLDSKCQEANMQGAGQKDCGITPYHLARVSFLNFLKLFLIGKKYHRMPIDTLISQSLSAK